MLLANISIFNGHFFEKEDEMPPVVLPAGFCAVTARVNVIVSQLGGVAQPGVALNVGYRADVNPWVVAPEPALCPAAPPECPVSGIYTIVTIEWDFQALGPGVDFSELGLDFKSKDHFQGLSNPGPPRWRHSVNVPPASSKGMMITLHLIDPLSLNRQDYEYIVNIELTNGLKIEIDPGYRVRP